MASSRRARRRAAFTAATASAARRCRAALVFGRRAGRRAAALAKERRGRRAGARGRRAFPTAEREWVAGLMRRDDGPLQADVRTSCCMLAHTKLGPIRDGQTLEEALAEYERIEREDVSAMRLDERARDVRQGPRPGARKRALRPQSRLARAHPGDRRAAAHRKPGRALPVGLSADRRRALAGGHPLRTGPGRRARIPPRPGEAAGGPPGADRPAVAS